MANGPVPIEQAVEFAVLSILDVLEELAQGLAWGQRPAKDWAEIVQETFEKHRLQIKASR